MAKVQIKSENFTPFEGIFFCYGVIWYLFLSKIVCIGSPVSPSGCFSICFEVLQYLFTYLNRYCLMSKEILEQPEGDTGVE